MSLLKQWGLKSFDFYRSHSRSSGVFGRQKTADLGKTLKDGLAEFGDLVRRDSNETIENVKKELKEEMKYSFCSIEPVSYTHLTLPTICSV